MDDSFFAVALVMFLGVGAVFGAIASSIWKNKGGDPAAGFLMGFFLSWVGLILAAVLTPAAKAQHDRSMLRECPFCKQSIRRDASVCPYCQRESRAWVLKDGWWFVRDEHENWFYLDPRTNAWIPAPTVTDPRPA